MSAVDVLARAVRAVVETLLPSACAACGEELDDVIGPACTACGIRLERELVGSRCASCSAPVAGRSADDAAAGPGGHSRCGPCAAWQQGQQGQRESMSLHAPRVHAGVARRLIHAFKYRGRRDVAEILALATARASDVLATLRDVDVIVPVPCDPVRRHQRGFDPTAVLAQELARLSTQQDATPASRRPRRPRVVRALRVKRSPPQVGRGAAARRAAPVGSMSPRWPAAFLVRGRRVALIDDVVTTGATLREAEDVLRRLGAAHVVALACTRAPGEIVRSELRP